MKYNADSQTWMDDDGNIYASDKTTLIGKATRLNAFKKGSSEGTWVAANGDIYADDRKTLLKTAADERYDRLQKLKNEKEVADRKADEDKKRKENEEAMYRWAAAASVDSGSIEEQWNRRQEIDSYEFSHSRLKIFTGPASLRKIGRMSFDQCKFLKEVVLPEGLEEIGDMAFRDCHRLKTITIPSTVSRIGALAFNDCYNLEQVIILGKDTEIGPNAFAGCPKLKMLK